MKPTNSLLDRLIATLFTKKSPQGAGGEVKRSFRVARKLRGLTVPALCVAAALLFGTQNASAADGIYWNVTTGKWEVTANWDLSRLPTDSDDVYIDNGGSALVDAITGTALSGNLLVGNSGTGVLNLTDGGKVTAASNIFLGFSTGKLDLKSGATIQFDYNNTDYDRIAVSGDTVIEGPLNISLSSLKGGNITTARTIITASGTMSASPTGTLLLNGLSLAGSRADGSTVDLDVNGNELRISDLTITGAGNKNVTWSGADGTNPTYWDITTSNWTDDVDTTTTFETGSTYAVQIDLANNGSSDRIVAKDDISIADGAALDVSAIDGSVPAVEGYEYLILQSTDGTIDKIFSNFTYERALYRLEQRLVNSNALYLDLKKKQPEFAKLLAGMGLDNAYNAAVAVDAIDMADLGTELGALYDALGNLEVDADVYAAAFTQLHGEVFAASREAATQTQRRFLRQLPTARDRAMKTSCDPCGNANSFNEWNRWASFTGDWLNRNNIGNFSGYDLRIYGVAFGMDKNVTKKLFVGAAFGYDDATQKFDTIRSRNEMDVFRSMLYGGWRSGRTYVDGYVGYTKNWHKTTRHISIGDFSGTAHDKFDDDMLSTGLEIGRKLRFGRLNVTPSIGLHYIYLDSPSATETDANGANLHVSGGKYDSLRLPIGARLAVDLRSRRMAWTPELRAFYVAELADDSASVRTAFNNVRNIGFTASSGHWGRSSGVFGVGLRGQLSDRLSLRVDYDHEVYEHTDMGEFSVSAGVHW